MNDTYDRVVIGAGMAGTSAVAPTSYATHSPIGRVGAVPAGLTAAGQIATFPQSRSDISAIGAWWGVCGNASGSTNSRHQEPFPQVGFGLIPSMIRDDPMLDLRPNGTDVGFPVGSSCSHDRKIRPHRRSA